MNKEAQPLLIWPNSSPKFQESEAFLKGRVSHIYIYIIPLLFYSKTHKGFFRRNVNETLNISIMWQFCRIRTIFSLSLVKTFSLHLDQRFFFNWFSFASTTLLFICSAPIAMLSCLYSTYRSLSSFWRSYLSITSYYLSEIMHTNS